MIRLSELKLPLPDLALFHKAINKTHNINNINNIIETVDNKYDNSLFEPHYEALIPLICKVLGIQREDLKQHTVYKRSYDARRSVMALTYSVDCELMSVELEERLLIVHQHHSHVKRTPDMAYYPVISYPYQLKSTIQHRPIVVGFGPCGIFSALILAQMGLKPIVLERGKNVRERNHDTWALWRKGILNPNSNAQFGEGGAGTFSDGKLYSQIKDPQFLGRKVIEEFIKAGAPPEIAVLAHPHIGTFRLVGIVENIRHQIIALGGEVRFEHTVTDIVIDNARIQGVVLSTGEVIESNHVVMALGHSARDTFTMLYERGVAMEAKAFAVGFRIEHPQSMVDNIRYGMHAGHPLLGAADYKLVHHAKNKRAVYSFCMCPGGTVVAATSEPHRVVTNGMSQYSRNERNANAGIVVNINPSDYCDGKNNQYNQYKQSYHPLSGIAFQRHLESNAYELGKAGGDYYAPAQLVGDFLKNTPSTQLGNVVPSYKPGVYLTDLNTALPAFAIDAIREGLPAFGKTMKGFDRADAVLTGVETRTSSPLKVQRNECFESPTVKGLYPAGEGAGYAGGILSAGVDGIKIAQSVALSMV